MIRALVGLGNPGPSYLLSRHNLGHWCVDALAMREGVRWRSDSRHGLETAALSLEGRPLLLAKTLSYMNESGGPIQSLLALRHWSVSELLVAHDDLDLPVGSVRLKVGGGSGGHNGLKDLIARLGEDFLRLRFGIGRPPPGDSVVDYVLSAPPPDEREALLAAVARALDVLPLLLTRGVEVATSRLHAPARAAERN